MPGFEHPLLPIGVLRQVYGPGKMFAMIPVKFGVILLTPTYMACYPNKLRPRRNIWNGKVCPNEER